jgi:hypothetical protein
VQHTIHPVDESDSDDETEGAKSNKKTPLRWNEQKEVLFLKQVNWGENHQQIHFHFDTLAYEKIFTLQTGTSRWLLHR